MKITVIGGDQRSVKLINLLLNDGHEIKIFGFDELETNSINMSESLELAIQNSNIIIGPLPCSEDNKILNTPFNSEEIKIEDLFKVMTKNQVFIAGKITEEISNMANFYNMVNIDLLDREELAVLNAIPTAEGGIQLAMEEMEITIHGSNVMILGFGRIGKLLAKMLNGLGANVFVEARNYADLAWIKSYGFKSLHLNEIKDYLPKMDLVFNTIPSMILIKENLLELKKETLVIDLASKPGGVDFENADKIGIKAIWALGLPGKVAPKTAAEIMKTSIYNIIEELGV